MSVPHSLEGDMNQAGKVLISRYKRPEEHDTHGSAEKRRVMQACELCRKKKQKVCFDFIFSPSDPTRVGMHSLLLFDPITTCAYI